MKFASWMSSFHRGLAVGLVGLWLAQQGAVCLAQEAKPTEQEVEKAEKKLLSTLVCPVTKLMDHGSYFSWYALATDGSGSCTPVGYNGPDQDPADCPDNVNMRCLDIAFVDRQGGFRHHHTNPSLERDGIDPAKTKNAELLNGARLIETTTIEFPKNNGPNGNVIAKVWFVEFTPPDRTEKVYWGFGHEVADGEPEQTFDKGEVVVSDRSPGKEKRASVFVLSDAGSGTWRAYEILLFKD